MADKKGPPEAQLIAGTGEAELMSEVDCACPECVAMCAHSTCLPTPDEALALIDAGYAHRLATYRFWPDRTNMAVVGPAPGGLEGARDLMHTQRRCTFFDGQHCELHACGLKPLEGRLAHHAKPWRPLRLHLIKQWQHQHFETVTARLERSVAPQADD